jgi:hypothetical protein
MQIDLAGSGAGVLNPTLEGDELIEGFVPTGIKAHVSVLFAAVSSPWITFAACFVPGLCGSSGHRRLQRGALHTRD